MQLKLKKARSLLITTELSISPSMYRKYYAEK